MGRSCKLNVLTCLLFIWGQLASPSWSQSQPLINQLAVLFRARPAWPTSFHSDPNANQNNLIGDTEGANSINYSDNDFTNLNDLLTSGNLDSQQNTISGSSTGPEGAIVRANSFYISSSTPPIIVKDATGTKPKGVLIAHPVLGPNQLSMNPEHKYNFQQHRPQGSTKVKLINTGGMGGGLYAAVNAGQNSGGNSPVVVPSLQTLISEGLKNHMKSHNRQSKMKQFIQGALGGNNHNNKYPQLFAVQGTPPSGARVIAIPIPSKIPFNPNLNNNGLQYVDTPQQQQLNQPGPLNYYPTGSNSIVKMGSTFGTLQNVNGNGFTQNQNQQQLQQQSSGQVQNQQTSFHQNANSNFQNNMQQNPHQHFQHQNNMQQQSFQQHPANNNFPQSQLALPQNIYLQNQNTNHPIQQQQQNQQPLIQTSFPHSMQNLHQPQNPQSFQQYQSQNSPYFGGLTTPQPQFTPANSLFNPSPLDFSSPITSASTTTTTKAPSSSSTFPPTNRTTTITTSASTTTTTTSPSTTTTIASTTTTTPQTTTTPKPYSYQQQSPYTSSYPSKFMTPSFQEYNTLQPTTQPPWRHYTSNNIQEVIVKSSNQIPNKNQGSATRAFHSSPSTLIGTFRYPDPPSPPQLQSLNTYHELPTFQTYATKSPQQLYNSYTDLKKKKKDSRGYFEPSISPVSPFAPTGSSGSSNTLSEASNTIQVSSGFGSSGSSRSNKWNKYNEGSHIVKPNLFQTKSITVTSDGNTGNVKHASEDGSFRPSPQLHSFEDSTSGLREYITVNPPSLSNRDSKSLQISDDLPAMESGFRPFNHFAFVNGVPGASISTTTETSVLNLIRNEFLKEMKSGQIRQWSEVDPTGSTPAKTKTRHERQYSNTGPSGYNTGNSNYNAYTTNQYNNHPSTSANPPTYSSFPTTNSFSNSNTIRYTTSTANPLSDQWVGRMASSSSGGGGGGHGHYSHSSPHRTSSTTTTSSSELYEDWLAPRRESSSSSSTFTTSTTTTKRPIYFTLGKTKNPLECEKFHRFGFCPVTSQYPLEQVEAIGSRCSTLLSHLVAPLPQTDVRYDVIVPKNGSHIKGRSAAPSGWSWKTFSGKPVCDTKEIKIVPGWAKNEQGEWLVILQSEKWKQEAQISLCTSQGTHYCEPSDGEKCEEKAPRSTKCVQRFTAQRLVVLDPYDQDRCPVVRSVFLPSACVCLNDDRKKHSHHHNHSSKHHHHHHHHNSNNNHHEINTYTSNNGHSSSSSSSSHKKSHKKTGRSLSTGFFGLGNDVELETAADSSTSVETSKPLVVKEIPTARSSSSTHTTSEKSSTTSSTSSPANNNNNKDTSSSGSEEDIPVISIRNPLNATVMVVTSEKASSTSSDDEGSASTESSVESSSNSPLSNSISPSTITTPSTSKPLLFSTSSTSSLGSSFIDSSRENSTESSSSSSSKSEENET